ncbi:MAG: hypothetical protein M0011_12890 [Elusimicrobia bacterium]|nr:hypothetical protein [Elusimicrobiota bacterium]
MDRAVWLKLFAKRFKVIQDSMDSLPGEVTYHIPEKQVVVIIGSSTPAGALRAESLTDTEECLIVNRGQGKRSFVDWDKIDAICTAET